MNVISVAANGRLCSATVGGASRDIDFGIITRGVDIDIGLFSPIHTRGRGRGRDSCTFEPYFNLANTIKARRTRLTMINVAVMSNDLLVNCRCANRWWWWGRRRGNWGWLPHDLPLFDITDPYSIYWRRRPLTFDITLTNNPHR